MAQTTLSTMKKSIGLASPYNKAIIKYDELKERIRKIITSGSGEAAYRFMNYSFDSAAEVLRTLSATGKNTERVEKLKALLDKLAPLSAAYKKELDEHVAKITAAATVAAQIEGKEAKERTAKLQDLAKRFSNLSGKKINIHTPKVSSAALPYSFPNAPSGTGLEGGRRKTRKRKLHKSKKSLKSKRKH